MLPSNYEPIAGQHPELRTALRRISDWVRQHSEWELLDPRVLGRDLRDLDAQQLAAALVVLGTSELFRRVFMVTTPSGTLADSKYDHPRQIPERLPDHFEKYFDTAESDVVPVLTAR